ncbi:MAG: aldehyde ferredoxin oxidoreductase family protein [Methanobacteriota archaeon]|nr:MAG: aldehyde ferredoxin oxidoreductase family protein [Euryarchaeota archaeon]
MADGYTGNILRVDLSEEKVSTEPINREWARQFIGGKGLGARYLFDELKPGTDPLSPDNVLSVWTGPLVGTMVPLTSRYVVITKSPLSGTFLDTYAGGYFGPELKYAGFDAVIVKGKAPKPSYLWVNDGKAEIRDAKGVWGKDMFRTEELLREEVGHSTARVAGIGQAGEKLSRIAGVTSDITRNAGRGGAGAVFGSKNLKAIVAKGSFGVEVPKIEEFVKMAKHMLKTDVVDNPEHAGLVTDGTPIIVDMSQDAAILPTNNWHSGQFDGYQGIDSDALKNRVFVRKKACFGCGIACGSWAKVKDGPFKGSSTEGPEYETLGLAGSNCGIMNIEAVVRFAEDCDRLGLDTISAGAAVGFAMDIYEKGVITKEDTGGLDLRFGNEEAYAKMPEMIAERSTRIGDLLAEGALRAAKAIGKDTEKLVIHSKGSEYPAYDPRGSIGMALAYATSDRGADHNRAWPVASDAYGDGDPWSTEGKAAICHEEQMMKSYKWSMIFCDFYGVSPENMAMYYTAVTGLPADADWLKAVGARVWNLVRAFNVREGFLRKDDSMPERMETEPLPSGKTEGKSVSRAAFDEMLSEYYKLWGWDDEGRPTKRTLEEAGLQEILGELDYLK